MKKTSKKSRESISVKRSWSAGGIVVNPRGQVLVVSQKGKSWSLPKGHREKGETREQAARREIAEETGVSKLEKLCLLGTYERYRIGRKGRDDKRRRKVITLFLFCTRQRVLRPQDRNNPEARWVSPNRVTELLTHQRDKDVFVRWWKKAHCYRIG